MSVKATAAEKALRAAAELVVAAFRRGDDQSLGAREAALDALEEALGK